MNKAILRKMIAYMTMIILTVTLGGCASKAENEKQSIKGTYVETKIELPEEMKNERIFKMLRGENGKPILYTADINSGHGIYKYEQKENEEWERTEVQWLNDLDIKDKSGFKIEFSKDGQEYFKYNESIDGWGYSHLLKKEENNTANEINIPGWQLDHDDPDYDFPSGLNILNDGNILILYRGGKNIVFDKETYEKVKEYEDRKIDVEWPKTVIKDDKIVCFTGNGNNQEVNAITYYDENFSEKGKIEVEKPQGEECPQDFYVDGNEITMLNSEGFHITNFDTKMWETIIDGDKTALSNPSLYEYMMIKGNDKEYYVLYESINGGYELLKYSYDGNVSVTNEKELTIYSLVENSTVRETISVFQRQHPEIKVNYRVSINDNNIDMEESEIDKTDYIKTLNTEILSGNGPDIIILDGLPIDSYIEKGSLADLSDIINPMLENKQILPNIIEKHNDNKVYSIPTKIKLPIIYGNSNIVKEASSLDELLEYSTNNKGSKLFGEITYDDLLKQFLPYDSNKFYNNKEIDEKALGEFLDKVKTMGDNIGALSEYPQDGSKSNTYSLASEAKIILDNSNGFKESKFNMAVVDYIHGGFTSYENSYVPRGQVGINASGKEIEICKEFIKVMLDSEIQKNDYYNGFPVKISCIEDLANVKDDHSGETEIENADGSYSLLKIGTPKTDEINELIDICKNVSNKNINDEVFFEVIIDNSLEFFKGNIDSDKCVQLIMEDSYVYLSE